MNRLIDIKKIEMVLCPIDDSLIIVDKKDASIGAGCKDCDFHHSITAGVVSCSYPED